MTSSQAFRAMICFLNEYYNKILSDDLGSLLGDMQLFQDGSGTWDSAVWNDWLVALENKELVTEIDAFKSTYNFLNAYYIRTSCSSSDIKNILHDISLVIDDKSGKERVWQKWIECVDSAME